MTKNKICTVKTKGKHLGFCCLSIYRNVHFLYNSIYVVLRWYHAYFQANEMHSNHKNKSNKFSLIYFILDFYCTPIAVDRNPAYEIRFILATQ